MPTNESVHTKTLAIIAGKSLNPFFVHPRIHEFTNATTSLNANNNPPSLESIPQKFKLNHLPPETTLVGCPEIPNPPLIIGAPSNSFGLSSSSVVSLSLSLPFLLAPRTPEMRSRLWRSWRSRRARRRESRSSCSAISSRAAGIC